MVLPAPEPPSGADAATPGGEPKKMVIEQCHFKNSYIAIEASVEHENLHVTDCFGDPLCIGIWIDRSPDNDRITRVHWNANSWKGADPTTLGSFTAQFGVGFLIGRADAGSLTDCFCIGYRRGFWFRGDLQNIGSMTCTALSVDMTREPYVIEGDVSGLRLTGLNAIQTADAPAPHGGIAHPGLPRAGGALDNAAHPAGTGRVAIPVAARDPDRQRALRIGGAARRAPERRQRHHARQRDGAALWPGVGHDPRGGAARHRHQPALPGVRRARRRERHPGRGLG
jgi:hypothetical protein